MTLGVFVAYSVQWCPSLLRRRKLADKQVQFGICEIKLLVRNPSKGAEQAKDEWLWS